jgi:hypothetical protein
MPRGKLSAQRSQQRKLDQELRRESRLSQAPERAFAMLTKRIEWLNDKIAWAQANDKPNGLYIEEREAVIWAVDKIRDLAKDLVNLSDSNQQLRVELGSLKLDLERAYAYHQGFDARRPQWQK